MNFPVIHDKDNGSRHMSAQTAEEVEDVLGADVVIEDSEIQAETLSERGDAERRDDREPRVVGVAHTVLRGWMAVRSSTYPACHLGVTAWR